MPCITFQFLSCIPALSTVSIEIVVAKAMTVARAVEEVLADYEASGDCSEAMEDAD